MAEKINTYYRALYHAEGMNGPVLTKRQLMNEIETSLLNISSTEPQISFSVSTMKLTEKQFKERSEDLKNYTYAGVEN